MLLHEEMEGGDSCVGVSQGVLWGQFYGCFAGLCVFFLFFFFASSTVVLPPCSKCETL